MSDSVSVCLCGLSRFLRDEEAVALLWQHRFATDGQLGFACGRAREVGGDTSEVLSDLACFVRPTGPCVQVRRKADDCMYAMKVLSKDMIFSTNAVEQSTAEGTLQLEAGKHDFVVNLRYGFQVGARVHVRLCARGCAVWRAKRGRSVIVLLVLTRCDQHGRGGLLATLGVHL